MSENPVSKEEKTQTLDFGGVTLVNFPAVQSINGDTAPAQLLADGLGTLVTDNGFGAHTIEVKADDPPFKFDALTRNLQIDTFAGAGTPGIVPDPGAAGVTDYLAADATFKPIPGGSRFTKTSWTNADIVAFGAVPDGALNLVVLPARTCIVNCWVIITGQAAIGGGGNFVQANVGYVPATDYEELVQSMDLMVAVDTIFGNDATRGTAVDIGSNRYNAVPSLALGTQMAIYFVTDGTLNNVTGSSGDIIFEHFLLP